MDQLATLEQASGGLPPQVGGGEHGWGKETRTAAKHCLQANILTRVSILETRSTPGAVAIAEEGSSGAGVVSGQGKAESAAGSSSGEGTTSVGRRVGKSSSMNHIGWAWPWRYWSQLVTSAPLAAPQTGTSQKAQQAEVAGLSSGMVQGMVSPLVVGQLRDSHNMYGGPLGAPVQWGQVYLVSPPMALPSGDMLLPLEEYLLPATKEKILRGEFVNFFLLLYRELEKKDRQDLDDK